MFYRALRGGKAALGVSLWPVPGNGQLFNGVPKATCQATFLEVRFAPALTIRRCRAVSIDKPSLLSRVAPLTPTLFFTMFFACGSKKRCFRLHFVAFLEVERFQNRVLGKSIKIIELHGHEAFSGDIGKGKKMVKMCTKSTKNRRSGKAQNVGGFGTVFECFCCVRQGPKECKLQCLCKS